MNELEAKIFPINRADHPNEIHAKLPRTPGFFDDGGGRVETVDFDYDEIERQVFNHDPEAECDQLSAEEMELALKMFRRLLTWIFQNGMKNPEGLQIRSIVACWVMLEVLHPLSLTEIARGFGKDKQSLGRWVDEWKKEFPQIRNPHIKH